MAARIQAKVLLGMCNFLRLIYSGQMHWACEAMNHTTACSVNPDTKSPYEMWYGERRPARSCPFCF